jgi:hypothetical protein
MKRTAIAVAVLLAALLRPGHSQSRRSEGEELDGFQGIWCFAGQVKVEGKRLSGQPFSVFAPKDDMTCCGEILKNSATDKHGHFLVEPLSKGNYYAKFTSRKSEEIVGFAVKKSYEKCDSSHLEIGILSDGKTTMQEYADIDDSWEGCSEYQPQCYRK